LGTRKSCPMNGRKDVKGMYLCANYCPLQYCVLDKPGEFKDEDRVLLSQIYQKLVVQGITRSRTRYERAIRQGCGWKAVRQEQGIRRPGH